MANLIITYWRDIPSAVSMKIGSNKPKDFILTATLGVVTKPKAG